MTKTSHTNPHMYIVYYTNASTGERCHFHAKGRNRLEARQELEAYALRSMERGKDDYAYIDICDITDLQYEDRGETLSNIEFGADCPF